MLETLALLIFAHFLADYPLQGDFLAKGKNRGPPRYPAYLGSIRWRRTASFMAGLLA
jgi:hypothetical protein